MSIWPWSDLVSMVMRYARPSGASYRILELGCGAGANVPFFLSQQVDYYAIEGSAHMVAQLKERYSQVAEHFVVGDFTANIPFVGAFEPYMSVIDLLFNVGPESANILMSGNVCAVTQLGK